MTRKRICFLYIAQAHQVLHSLTVALELARHFPELEVEVATTSPASRDYIEDLIPRLGGPAIRTRLLGPAWLRRGATPPKVAMLAANLPRLSRYDAIVTPERTTALVRRMGLRRQLLVYTQHGAGDRGGPFEPRLAQFDLVFASGRKLFERMVGPGLVTAERCAVVGYPKFDLVDALAPARPRRLFAEDLPVVVYNPHFDPAISSWPRLGPQVLAAFAADRRHNLIFAPHIRLFEGASSSALEALAPFRDHPRILLDLGGPAAIDMTYTGLADVYLGDTSSQVYEFIRTPRPCVFLNAHRVAWQGDENYLNWTFGPVLETTARLPDVIDAARRDQTQWRPAQEAAFGYSFDTEGPPASRRAAQAIADLLLSADKRPR
jgi:hypothetical protein